ncbi:FkbM family methyltransferase [Cellulomonas hominis]
MPPEMFVSHAQNGEDVVLRRALRDVELGRYVDVGANHPYEDSISRSFYDAGWRGLTVEPVARLAALHRAQRPGDVLFEGVVSGSGADHVTLHTYPEHGLSTTVDAVHDLHARGGRVGTDVEVAAAGLDALLDGLGWGDEPIHFMTVDTEGAEASVLASIDLRRWRPWVLVIESTVPNSAEPSHHVWEPEVLASGYRFCLFDGLSRFYVAEEHADRLAASLSYPACALDHFVTWHTVAAQERIASLDVARNQAVQDALRWRTASLGRWVDSVLPQSNPEFVAVREERDRLAAEAGGLRGELGERQRQYVELQRTLSWRVTRPLRAVRRLRTGR